MKESPGCLWDRWICEHWSVVGVVLGVVCKLAGWECLRCSSRFMISQPPDGRLQTVPRGYGSCNKCERLSWVVW
eukprot:scaffold7593_cov63-Cyclotella_meneghiniana.AAC.1